MPSIRTFKTFLAVARHGTFAAAGKEIGLTAAAVGLQIRGLEEELDQVLFDRGPRSVVLNVAGRNIIPEIEELVLRYEALVAGGDSDELSGTVVMGALVSALMGAFADALWSVKREHPQLKVRLFAGMSSDFAYKVEHGEIDAAVVTQSPRSLPTSLIWTPLYTEPMVLIVPRQPHFTLPDTPLDILRRAPFIRFDRHTWTGDLVKDVLSQCKVKACDEMELNSVEAIVEIVRQGFGVSIVPQLTNVHWERDQDLSVIPLPGIEVERRVGLLERTRHGRMRFTAAIKEYFREGGPRVAPRQKLSSRAR
ncbi:LysR family transcriptional regulator [Parazoarcus communis]|uniref:LysR family transcriptional regulator n=1 Tax=Parazoarcus communis TaxID=41977 RepID=A0A2U8H0P1_9RHOO|nr:LysR family transcriptional regulator [Parazoarcus communis]AWI79143.1 LysR family transcriptional regulator [Parazoarcus communis]